MQYYTFALDEESQKLCIISTPFGLFKYKDLPMGVKQLSDIVQEVMEGLFSNLETAEGYIDDVSCFSHHFEEHIQTLSVVLTRLEENGFTVNPGKCEWAVTETDWLGYWLTPTGLKPWSKKIQAILGLQSPRNIKQVRSFIGAVTYYCDMWTHRSHTLAPLANLTGKALFIWTAIHQKAFDDMKKLMTKDILLSYPDHNLPFDIYTNASDYQLGAVIFQKNTPVAYYSRKLTTAQQNYTTIEKELLLVITTLNKFCSMQFGAEIHIFTDHCNLTFTNLNTQCVLCWRIFIEEFHPTFHYVKGTDNVIADTLSCLPCKDTWPEESQDSMTPRDNPFFFPVPLSNDVIFPMNS